MTGIMWVLVAGLGLGNGPADISSETVESLDLRGHWEGISPSTFPQLITGVEVKEGSIRFHGEGVTILTTSWKVIDEGDGKLRIEWKERKPCLGIYRWNDNRLVICYREASKGRPSEFRVDGANRLIILRRVKPRK